MASSESPVLQNTNKAAKYTNCAMPQELKQSTLYNSSTSRLCGMNSLRNWFPDGMCSVLKALLNTMECNLIPVSVVSYYFRAVISKKTKLE